MNKAKMVKRTKSLLFIPDITGFTNFVNETEIQHSQHIISELLETIIDSNKIGMEVSEIEGDAVLFYKDTSPDFETILSQVKHTFLDFHKQIKTFESKRICHCGACLDTINLSLKFVIHLGEIGFTVVKEKKKPFGTDLILVHRLLKNNIDQREYVLVTDSIGTSINQLETETWADFQSGQSYYDQFGDVKYFFAPLKKLHEQVEHPVLDPLPEKVNHPFRTEILIDFPIQETYEMFTNFGNRMNWVGGLEDFLYEKDRVNQVGIKHRCLVGNNQFFDFETVTNDFGQNDNQRMVYGERLLNFPLIKDAINYYIFDDLGQQTRITGELHIRPIPIIGNIMLIFLKKKLVSGFTTNMIRFEKYCNKMVPVDT